MRGHGNSARVLVVEGHADKRLIQGLRRHSGITEQFDVRYPGEDGRHPGKSGAMKRFTTLLDEAVEPGRFEAIGLFVDADFPQNGKPANDGFVGTAQALNDCLARAGFRQTNAIQRTFIHPVSGCRASFWISPSHGADGHVETMLVNALVPSERTYLDSVVRPFLNGLSDQHRRFDERNRDRAELYVYLGLQRKPDKSVPTLFDDGLADAHATSLSPLTAWMQHLFS